MVSKQEKVRAGAFVVGSLALLLLSVLALRYAATFEESREYFFLYDKSVAGLEKGSKVTFKGVPVGKVKQIGFTRGDYSKIRVVLSLTTPEEELPILDDTEVRLDFVSFITGTLFVELKGGEGKRTHDPSMPLRVQYSILDNLEQRLERMDLDVKQVLQALNDLLSEKNREKVNQFLSALEKTSNHLEGLATRAEQALETTGQAVTTIRETLTENRKDIQRTISNAADSLESVKTLTKELQEKQIPEMTRSTLTKLGELAEQGKSLEARGEDLLKRLDESVRAIQADMQQVLAGTQKSVESASRLINRADTLVADSSGDVQASLKNMRQASETIQQLADTMNALIANKSPTVVRILENLKTASNDLKALVEEVRRQPSTLIGRSPKEERKFPD